MRCLLALIAPALLLTFDALAAEVTEVSQRNKLFTPAQVTLNAGGGLSISNDDPAIHHLYVDTPGFQFDSGEQLPGARTSITFPMPGDFAVRCAIHPRMRLDVRVINGAAPEPSPSSTPR